MRIALLGPYPDFGGNIGGISMHIKRMRRHLLLAGHHPVVYASCGAGNPAQHIYRVRNELVSPWVALREYDALVHLHTTTWHTWALGISTKPLRQRPTILTVHNEGLQRRWNCASRSARIIIRTTLRLFDHIVAVNDHVADTVRRIAGAHVPLSMIPAFVPPVPAQADRDAVPARVWDFARRHHPIVSVNGWIEWTRTGTREDLYGFDLALQALRVLRADFPELGLIAAVCGIPSCNRDLWLQTQELAASLGVAEHVCWVTEGCEYYPILEVSQAMVRPTRTDGWPLSIGEAMYFGVPAIASDVCVRPRGTLLFRSGDAVDLAAATSRALRGETPATTYRWNCHEDLLALYERMAREPN